MTIPFGRLKAFAHLDTEKTHLYRAIMQVFTGAKERFLLHLRPKEILQEVRELLPDEALELSGIETALAQLCQWENLEAHADTAEVATVEDFKRPRYLYQLTRKGEAVEQALGEYHRALGRHAELQAAALSEIRELLGELELLAAEPQPDEGKVLRVLTSLRSSFEAFTNRAQLFMASLHRRSELHSLALDSFLDYKKRLIEYLERFIGELVVATDDIAESLERLDAAGIGRLLALAGEREVVDALAPTPVQLQELRAAAIHGWERRWAGLRGWFIAPKGGVAQAEILRSRARAAIPAMLSAVAGIHDRRTSRSDRVTDLRTLAVWFAQTPEERDLHRLWRAAFGLSPSRHLLIDEATLEAREARPQPPATSWLDAPPLAISPRLRATGRNARPGRPSAVIDRSEGREYLAWFAGQEAEQLEQARALLSTRGPVRLSELGQLDRARFWLFLDLLGAALSRKTHELETVEAASSDGGLHLRLEPIPGAATAFLETQEGVFSGPDHTITIRQLFPEEAPP